MGVTDLILAALVCVKVAPVFVLIGLGLRYLFYNIDGWNLDRIYEKYFKGRRKKKYRQFTQRTGLVLLSFGLLYTWWVVWPMILPEPQAYDRIGQRFSELG
ncbi:MAG: hypothetical protein AAGJ81_10315 [Verrucomicrobiota bacterium]